MFIIMLLLKSAVILLFFATNFTVIFFVFADDNYCNCGRFDGRNSKSNSRIYNGHDAPLGRFPWQILVKVTNTISKSFMNYGGVIISKKHIVTCAHCLKPIVDDP